MLGILGILHLPLKVTIGATFLVQKPQNPTSFVRVYYVWQLGGFTVKTTFISTIGKTQVIECRSSHWKKSLISRSLHLRLLLLSSAKK